MRTSGGPVAFAHLLEQISEISQSARHVVVCRDALAQLGLYLDKSYNILKELFEGSKLDLLALQASLQQIESEVKNAKEVTTFCTIKSKFYLLLNCRVFTKCVQGIIKAIGVALLQIVEHTSELSLQTKNRYLAVCKDMQGIQLKVTTAEEELVDEIESSLQVRHRGTELANEVLYKITQVTGVAFEPSTLKLEYDLLKKEFELLSLDKHQTGVLQLGQIISLLSCADALGSATERETQYYKTRVVLDGKSLPPLQTFYCPITQDVMENPVEIASGHTFEMSAIQKWFAEGHNVCPVTKIELENLSMKPNRLLKQSIEEWRDRNTVIRLAGMPSRLKSDQEEEITEVLLEIQELCNQKSVHKYWIAAEGLIPVLVGFLGSTKRDIRKKALTTLGFLIADNLENKNKICNAGAIEYAVRSLARDAAESRQAVALLLELAKEESLCEQISKAQGCILLLVTMANSENTHAAADAKEVLRLLSTSNENVMLMAEVNYFKPLVQSLDEGSHRRQILMANTLSRMQLTDQGRSLLVQGGVLAPLVKMASEGDMECKAAAVGAFRNLSVLPENRDPMIEAGIIKPLLEVLFTVKSIAATIREHAAATFANLAMSSQAYDIKDLWGDFNSAEEAILQLILVFNLTGPNIQSHILRALSHVCVHQASRGIRETIRDGGGVPLVIRFIESKDLELRLHALKLLWILTQDGGGDVLAQEMTSKDLDYFSILVSLFSSESEEEKVAAMGILSNLPINDRLVTEKMLKAGVLSSIANILEICCSRGSGKVSTLLVENATLTLIRFTLPTDLQLQRDAAEHNIIPMLVTLLSIGTSLSKSRAAFSLQQFSESTIKLSVPIKRSGGWCCFTSPPQPGCIIHGGFCTVKDTFCLLEADALSPLIQMLEDPDEEIDGAALCALATVFYDECLEQGCEAVAKADGVLPIIRKLNTDSEEVQEKALWILERIFRKEKYKSQFGSIAQMPLVSLTQSGTSATRPLAAKILAHLNVLHEQSSYF